MLIGLDVQIIRLLIASLVGFLIGFERLRRGKPAGISTYSIICITSCLLTMLSYYGFGESSDSSRLIANIITSIGFVAGGVIFTYDKNQSVKVSGLTTGATLFCVSSIGIAVGLGYIYLTIAVVVLIELNIYVSLKLKKYLKNKNKEIYDDDDE